LRYEVPSIDLLLGEKARLRRKGARTGQQRKNVLSKKGQGSEAFRRKRLVAAPGGWGVRMGDPAGGNDVRPGGLGERASGEGHFSCKEKEIESRR